MRDFAGRTVFVTGATAGIGRACAEAFATAGARLVLCARRAERLNEIAAGLEKEHGVPVHAIALDVRHREAVASAVASIPAEFRPVEVLVRRRGSVPRVDDP